MFIAEKVSLNPQVEDGTRSLKIYTMEKDLYKQIKLLKKQYLNLKQQGNKGTSKLQAISLITYLSKKSAINQ